MQLKTNPQIDALKKPAASRTTVQVKPNPQIDALKKPAASTTTVQVNRNPQIDALKKPAASTTTVQVKPNPTLDALNKQAASTTTKQVNRNPQVDALNKRLASRTTAQVKTKPQLNALNKRLASSEKNIPSEKKSNTISPKSCYNNNPRASMELNSLAIDYCRTILENWYESGGRRLLEILFVFFILVWMSAIALPSFMFCGTQRRPARARQYIDSMNRAQQAKYAENGTFSNSLNALGFVIETETANSRNHKYSISATKNAAFSYAVNNDGTNYVGAVFLVPVSPASNNEMTTVSILCTANSSRNTQPPNPILQNGVPVCAAGTKSEAHQYVDSLNYSQEFHFQRSGGFSYFFSHLIPGSNQTINYKYSVSAKNNAAFSYGVSRSNYFRSYVGAVFLVPVSSAANNKRTLVPVSEVANKEKTTLSIMCVANSPGNIKPANPSLQNNVPVCAAGSSEVSK